jgi:two-component system phosphate regulon sensor histidine kinase PhoR
MVLRLGLPMTTLEQQIDKLERGLAIAFGTAFLLAMVISIWGARSLTKPLSDMADKARQLAAGTLGLSVTRTPGDEVQLLSNTLNQMTEQLELKMREVTEDRTQLVAMLTAMVEGVMVLDAQGTILQVNPALERMFSLLGAEVRGRPCREVIQHPQLGDLIAAVLKTQSGQSADLTLHPSDRQLHMEASCTGYHREHEACAVFVFHDTTELRRLEKVRKDFVANVSHELRTPLTAIKGYVEALIDGGRNDADTLTRFLDIILNQSNRLNLLLEDLLQLSHIESGQILFKQEPVSLRAVIERTLSVIQPLAEKRGHSVKVVIPEGLPLVEGDEDRLSQVVSNLLDNAVKYTPDGGTITVEAKTSTGRVQGTTIPFVELSVSDSGIGIPEAERPRVFERFYRVDKARSRALGGTGLGLAIVKHIVEGHKGHVWVEPNEPRGSRFLVRLPLTQESVIPVSR